MKDESGKIQRDSAIVVNDLHSEIEELIAKYSSEHSLQPGSIINALLTNITRVASEAPESRKVVRDLICFLERFESNRF